MNVKGLDAAALSIRSLSMDAIQKAKSGHPGMPLGCAELGAMLYGELLNHNPKDPAWINRDRFVLSGGHGSMLLYSALHLSGYDVSLDDIKNNVLKEKDIVRYGARGIKRKVKKEIINQIENQKVYKT